MDSNWFRNWKEKVTELNEWSDEIDKGRGESYKILSDELKRAFSANGTIVDTIHFSSDGSVITVYLDGKTENSIHFKKSFLESIGMPFSVQRRLNNYAENEMFIEIYPLEED